MRKKNLKYQQECLELVEKLKKEYYMETVIDVGGWDGFFVKRTSFKEKTVVDIKDRGALKNIEYVHEDFLTWKCDKKYDLAVCMQVLEHLDTKSIQPFVEKLFKLSDHVVISVPYKWKKGFCKYHKQDPVTVEKLNRWTDGRVPDNMKLIKDDGSERLICYYKQNSYVSKNI